MISGDLASAFAALVGTMATQGLEHWAGTVFDDAWSKVKGVFSAKGKGDVAEDVIRSPSAEKAEFVAALTQFIDADEGLADLLKKAIAERGGQIGTKIGSMTVNDVKGEKVLIANNIKGNVTF